MSNHNTPSGIESVRAAITELTELMNDSRNITEENIERYRNLIQAELRYEANLERKELES